MSEVLKRVDAKVIMTPWEMVQCEKCGSGFMLSEDGKEHASTEEYRQLVGTPHSCGNNYEYATGHWVNKMPAYTLVKCDCGRKVECSGFTTTCDCGRDYNWNGTQLADRSQWGEDTDEHWTDCY